MKTLRALPTFDSASMSGASTDWVRLAELREDEALEQWERVHPIQADCLKRLKYWRGATRRWLASEQGQRYAGAAKEWQIASHDTALKAYLLVTRWSRCRPARHRVRDMSTKSLLEEAKKRGVDTQECVERIDLLDALCGLEEADESCSRDLRDGSDAPGSAAAHVDKMV